MDTPSISPSTHPPVLLLVLALSLMGVVAGCDLGSSRSPAGPLQPSAEPYDKDVPLPAGFELIDQSSEDWLAGPTRYLRHRYRGVSDKARLRTFYREQMPLIRWSLLSDSLVPGRYTMRFQRNRETCTITIEDARGRRGRVDVEVLITPISREQRMPKNAA